MTDWVQRLALVIAKARHGPGLDMGGAHNPRPSEMDSARRFLEMYEYNKAKEKGRSAAEWHRYLHQEGILVEDEPGQECGPWHHRVFLDEEDKNEAEAAQPLDVERLGFRDLLDIGQAILDRAYPPDTIVRSHDVKADIGANTTAAIADLIASCRARLGGAAPERLSSPQDQKR